MNAVNRHRSGTERISRLVAIVTALAVALTVILALRRLSRSELSEGREILETAVRRSTMSCYAAEGVYPPDVDYLKEHYGLIIDENRYTVKYDAFAENLMPYITVLEN